MVISDALTSYFTRLEEMYFKSFGTLPTISWSPDMDASLFVGKPDEDQEIQWKAAKATPLRTTSLCEELRDFFGSFYYWELKGEYNGILFVFPPIPTSESAENVINIAILDGEYYFPNQDTVFLASCFLDGNDDLLLFYRQKSRELFIYDTDKRFVLDQNYSLVELICSMKAVI